MVGVDKSSPYRKALIELICSINNEIPLEEKNQVLMVMILDTEEKISNFNGWVKKNLKDGKLEATEEEIVRAAVKASKMET